MNGQTISAGHREKFDGFIRLCEESKGRGLRAVVIVRPWVLGDTYEEVMTNLGLLARHGLELSIVAPNEPPH
jgi:hypothetical protein